MQSYRRILLSGLLRTPTGLMNLLQMTVLSYYFGNNGRTPYVHYMLFLGIPAFLGQLIAAGVAPKLADKYGAATTFAQANVFAGLALLSAFALFLCRPQQLTQALPFTLLILLLFCNMFCCGLVNTVQSILIADAADQTEKESGIRRDGIFVSGQSLLIKLSTGVSALLQGLVFAISGFSGTAVRQINRALYTGADFATDASFATPRFAMFFLFLCLPGISYLLSALPYRKSRNPHKAPV